MDRIYRVGGQAVIEGVMMRGPHCVATAVRTPSGSIEICKENVGNPSRDGGWRNQPILRGIVVLYESLFYGTKSLLFSAQISGDESEKMSDKEIWITVCFSLVMAFGLFFAVPTVAAHFLFGSLKNSLYLNASEGILRMVIFLLYMFLISMMKDVRRVFEYHGAEHKTIFCYEKGLPMTVENVQRQSRFHPRCGTNFLMIIMIVSFFVFAFLGWPSLVERIFSRIVLIPLIAGVAYEWIRFAADSKSPVVCALNAPGVYLELLTTREPSAEQIEVAIRSLQEALRQDKEEEDVVYAS